MHGKRVQNYILFTNVPTFQSFFFFLFTIYAPFEYYFKWERISHFFTVLFTRYMVTSSNIGSDIAPITGIYCKL